MSRTPWVPDRQDIIWINFNPQVGREMRDMHPMLVLSPEAFNDTGVGGALLLGWLPASLLVGCAYLVSMLLLRRGAAIVARS